MLNKIIHLGKGISFDITTQKIIHIDLPNILVGNKLYINPPTFF